MSFLPLVRPDLTFDEVKADLDAVVSSGRLTGGPFLEAFEELLRTTIGTSHAVATTSATTALHLTLEACGLEAGDEVLVSDFTFPATANAVVHAGATPVLVDCAEDSFVLDPGDLASKITERSAAVVVVDPFGIPVRPEGIRAVTDPAGIRVVEDAACALGSSSAGEPCGRWSDAACFSFHPRKVITTGEGGAVTTDDDELAARMRLLRNQGKRPTDGGAVFTDFGFNYRLSEVAAVLGLAQLGRLEAIMADRRRTATRYAERLGGLEWLRIPEVPDSATWNVQSYVVQLSSSIDRDAVITAMRDVGIETTLGTYALHAQPVFAGLGYEPGDLPNAYRAQESSLTLPVLPRMETTDVDRVVAALVKATKGGR